MASPENAALDNFTRLEPDALARTIEAHRQYLIRAPGGQRALLGFHDLSEYDFSRANLSEADFSGAKLHRTRFREAKLQILALFQRTYICRRGNANRPPASQGGH